MATEDKWQKMMWVMKHYDAASWNAPIRVGSSIWITQRISNSGGMVEYHPASDTDSGIIDYPAALGKMRTGLRDIISFKYKNDSIVILSSLKSCGFVFDTKTREFKHQITIQRPKDCDSSLRPECRLTHTLCTVIGDYMHIIGNNLFRKECKVTTDYTIYSMIDKSIQNFKNSHLAPSVQLGHGSQVIKIDECYQSSNKMLISGFIRNQTGNHSPAVIIDLISHFATFELFKFGGFSYKENKCFPFFYIGTLKDANPAKPIEWTLAPQYELKLRIRDFGYIQHGPFIVTFGGTVVNEDGIVNGRKFTSSDDIFILDLRKNCGWIKSPIKCMQKGVCYAALDNNDRVHVWFVDREPETHYCIRLSDLFALSTL